MEMNDLHVRCSLSPIHPSLSRACTHLTLWQVSHHMCAFVNTDIWQARAVMAGLAVDGRERGLIRCLAAKRAPHRVLTLPVGDVSCEYSDSGCAWILERKRADDFAASIQAPYLFVCSITMCRPTGEDTVHAPSVMGSP